ncbi:MAG: hypothetical protein C4334_12610 [Pyrinomonas sp.]
MSEAALGAATEAAQVYYASPSDAVSNLFSMIADQMTERDGRGMLPAPNERETKNLRGYESAIFAKMVDRTCR